MSSNKTEVAVVPAHPVALIEVDPETGTVLVNGRDVEVPDGMSLHVAGVHAAARRVAQVLDRPVRALAKDPSGQTSLIINPDGSVSNIQPPASPAATPTLAPVVTPVIAPAVAPAAPAVTLVVPPPVDEHQVDEHQVDEHQVDEHQFVAPARVKRSTRRRGVAVAAVAALALVGIGGAVLIGIGGEGREEAQEGSTSAPSADAAPSAEASASAPAEPVAVAPGELLTAAPVLSATAVGGVEALRLRVGVTASEEPLRAGLELVRLGADVKPVGDPITRNFRVGERGLVVRVEDLAAGRYRWSVSAAGAEPVTGRVVVRAPEVAPVIPETDPAEPDVETEAPQPDADNGGGTPSNNGGNTNNDNGGGGGSGGTGPSQPHDPGEGNDDPDGPVGRIAHEIPTH